MAKQYEKASEDVRKRIAKLRDKYHQELQGITIDALFCFSDESEQVLSHQGYPAYALTKVNGLRERAAGLGDALIVIDRYAYSGLKPAQMDALIDHELHHLVPVIDEETEQPKFDTLGRMKIAIRKHDRQFGWFDEIAQRHGENSIEVSQAKALIEDAQQLYFDFGAKEAA